MSRFRPYLLDNAEDYSDDRVEENAPIFGVRWDKGATPTMTRIGAAKGLTANVGLDDGQRVVNDFDYMPIFRDMTSVTDSLGNVFIRIPKFYIRKIDDVNYKTWEVSKYQHTDFYLPWCFWDFTKRVELDYFDFGAHLATSDGGGTPKLQSKPDLYPLCNQNIVTFRTYAEANGVGYQQLDIHAIDVLRTLLLVEFATLNMQTIMYGFTSGYYGSTHKALDAGTGVNFIVITNAQGAMYEIGQTVSIHLAGTTSSLLPNTYGRTITNIQADTPGAGETTITFDGDPIDIAVGDFVMNTAWKTGFSDDITASSGSLVSNSGGKYPCMYRGIESPYADIYQFVDGVNITARQAWVCDDADDYASNVFAAPYEEIGYVNHDANRYAQAMGWDENYPYAEFPVSVQGSSVQYYCDYYYQGTGSYIARFGGFWLASASTGPSFWFLLSSSAVADVRIGGRLCRKAV